MNQVINADFTALELRVLANMNMWDIRPRGERISAPDFLIGLKRDPLEAPNASSIKTIKPRFPAIRPLTGLSEGIYMDFDTPLIHRVRSGLQ